MPCANVNDGPPFSATNSCPSSSNCRLITRSPARIVSRILDFLNTET
jgi:hypothetical protein